MPKVTITIEDTPNGKVKVVCSPSFEQIAKAIAHNHPDGNSNAFGMTVFIANRLVQRQKELRAGKTPSGLIIPRLAPGKMH
jgi:hypothetical protein